MPCSEQSEQVNAALLLKDLPPTMREALKVRVGLARTRSGRMATTQVRVQPVQLQPLPFIQIRPLSLHPVKAGRPQSNHTARHPQLKAAGCSPQSLRYLPAATTDAAVPSSTCKGETRVLVAMQGATSPVPVLAQSSPSRINKRVKRSVTDSKIAEDRTLPQQTGITEPLLESDSNRRSSTG